MRTEVVVTLEMDSREVILMKALFNELAFSLDTAVNPPRLTAHAQIDPRMLGGTDDVLREPPEPGQWNVPHPVTRQCAYSASSTDGLCVIHQKRKAKFGAIATVLAVLSGCLAAPPDQVGDGGTEVEALPECSHIPVVYTARGIECGISDVGIPRASLEAILGIPGCAMGFSRLHQSEYLNCQWAEKVPGADPEKCGWLAESCR